MATGSLVPSVRAIYHAEVERTLLGQVRGLTASLSVLDGSDRLGTGPLSHDVGRRLKAAIEKAPEAFDRSLERARLRYGRPGDERVPEPPSSGSGSEAASPASDRAPI
jgi:hypothetical protein